MRLPSTIRTLLAVVLCGLCACGPFSPEVQAANRYLRQIQPLLVENGHLAERILVNAAGLYNKQGTVDEVADSWTTEVVPLAEHLHNQSSVIDPESAWEDRQKALVDIWGERAQAYRGLSESIIGADRKAWHKNVKQARAAQLAEEAWFKETNATLAGLGIRPISATP